MIAATPFHAPALALMHAQAFPHDPWPESAFASLLTQPGVFGLIEERGGFLLMRAVLDEAEILTIGTTVPRQGIGLALMQAGIAQARGGGVIKIHLEVAADNEAARALYGKLGFTRTGQRRNYYPGGGDALTLSLDLS